MGVQVPPSAPIKVALPSSPPLIRPHGSRCLLWADSAIVDYELAVLNEQDKPRFEGSSQSLLSALNPHSMTRFAAVWCSREGSPWRIRRRRTSLS